MHATNTIACDIFGHRFHFYAFSTFFDGWQLYDMSRIRFDPLSREFSNRRVFDENAQRISVDGRPKRIEMYATFSNENALVLTCPKLNASFVAKFGNMPNLATGYWAGTIFRITWIVYYDIKRQGFVIYYLFTGKETWSARFT